MKSRGVYETPGGAILHFAHRQMESLTMDREVMHLRDTLIPRYSALVYNGFWFAPEREALQALITESQKNVTGYCPPQALQREHHCRWEKESGQPLQPRDRDNGGRLHRSLQSERCNRVHSPKCPAPESGGGSQSEGLRAIRILIVARAFGATATVPFMSTTPFNAVGKVAESDNRDFLVLAPTALFKSSLGQAPQGAGPQASSQRCKRDSNPNCLL